MKYWLKGGIIASIIGFFITLFALPFLLDPLGRCGMLDIICPLGRIAFYLMPGFIIYQTFLYKLAFGIDTYNQNFNSSTTIFTLYWVIILNSILIFVIGTLIGWIYEKRKQKNKK